MLTLSSLLKRVFAVWFALLLAATHAAAPAYRNAVLADSPIGYWQMDEATVAGGATDAAGTPQNGVYENVTLGQSSAFPNLGTCGSFNGANSRVRVPFDASFNLGAGAFSVECWYRVTTDARSDIFNFKNAGDFGIFANQAGTGSIGGWHNGQLPGGTAPINEWHHVVYTRSGTILTLYVDGVQQNSGTDSQAMSSSADIVIGANQQSIWFTGEIDEVAYYNTALSAARVLAHYNAAQTPPTAPTVANGTATNVLATSATLAATVTNTGNEAPVVTIFYGATDGGTNGAAWAGNISLGTQAGAATGNVTGLTQGTSYFYRARAVNSAGTAWASTSATFTTPIATLAAVQNLSAANVGANSAELRGQVTATGNHPPAITIYYGLSDGGTNPAAWASSVAVPGNQSGIFSQTVTGLAAETTYYSRCFAQNLAGSVWAASSQTFTTPVYTPPSIVINELHVAEDDATIHSEFIELFNAGSSAVNLSGWFFDKGINYTFPAGITLGAGAYLIVCEDPATMQSRYGISGATVLSWQDPGTPEWNSLSNNGETVTLREAGGNKVDEVDYDLGFPWPTFGDLPSKSLELIHPSLDNELAGHWRSSTTGPTPRAANSVRATNAPPAVSNAAHAAVLPVAGQTWMRSAQQVRITAKVTDPNGVQTVSLQYQIVQPGDYIKIDDPRYNAAASWTTLAMQDNGTNGDVEAADGVYSAIIPASAQTHRRLVRYRITVADPLGATVRVPYADDPQPNFAYFVYDGVPAWTGARQPGATPVTYSSALLESVQQYHLITRVEDHGNSQYVPVPTAAGGTHNPPVGSSYGGEEYPWHGALCHDGAVYDHVRFRARGGVWRYAMGKNMWKFDMNKGHDLTARDNYGREYGQKWKKLNFSSVIQQGDFQSRGEQGLYEGVGFRLFQLTGLPAEHTQFAHFRIIERPNETNATASQFDDDFQGLYLAIEQQDGQFLDEHGLPDGNLYKMEGGTGELNNQGPSQPSNKSDLNAFLAYGSTEQWWRDNCDLANYYNYRTIVDAIHHYDIADGKNYFYYHNPVTNKWTVLPWDLDLTWTDNAYRAGAGIAGLSGPASEPIFPRIYGNGTSTGIPALRTELRNRAREILDLLYNPEQAGMLIEELAGVVYQPGQPSFVDADRAMWDYNPILVSTYVNSSKAGHGRFYGFAVDNPATPQSELGTFPGMIQRMKNYVVTRRNAITSEVLTPLEESLVPTTPVVTAAGGAGSTIPTNALTFTSSAFSGKNGATFSAMKWRLAAVTEPGAAGFQPYNRTAPRLYEADPANTWESPETTTFGANYTFPPIAAAVGQTCRVRVKHRDSNGRWSHWSAPRSFTAGAPDINVYLQSLVVSQVMYNPVAPSAAEQVVAQSPESYEWIEVMNVGPGTVDLTPIRFTEGIEFNFAGSAVTSLAPGARVVVVSNLAAFNLRYSGQLAGVQIAGEWKSGDALSNGGEEVQLSYGANTPIRNFTYDDELPWPLAADQGHALVLVAPGSLPNHKLPASWRGSISPRGTPGKTDGTTYEAWAQANSVVDPSDDGDGDGLPNLGEYGLHASPSTDSTAILPTVSFEDFGGQLHLTFTFQRNLAADDVILTPQISSNLRDWFSDPSNILFVSETNHADGTSTVVYRAAEPFNPTASRFMRLHIRER